jgi:hypothetical protein
MNTTELETYIAFKYNLARDYHEVLDELPEDMRKDIEWDWLTNDLTMKETIIEHLIEYEQHGT